MKMLGKLFGDSAINPEKHRVAQQYVTRQFRDLIFGNLKGITMEVTTENYGSLAWRTAKIMTSNRDMLAHGALGLLTEVSELAEALVSSNAPKGTEYIKKELGDIIWFANYIYHSYVPSNLNLVMPIPMEIAQPFGQEVLALQIRAGNIGSMIKAHLYYNKPFDLVSLVENLNEIVVSVNMVCKGFGFTFQEVLQTNIDKLRQRYPEQYTDQDAIERKDEAPLTATLTEPTQTELEAHHAQLLRFAQPTNVPAEDATKGYVDQDRHGAN
jgi:NTP pyrophosphatase (non-canonical NTP hydrolase)